MCEGGGDIQLLRALHASLVALRLSQVEKGSQRRTGKNALEGLMVDSHLRPSMLEGFERDRVKSSSRRLNLLKVGQ